MRLQLVSPRLGRGSALTLFAQLLAGGSQLCVRPWAAAAASAPLDFTTATNGLQWADAKVGSGAPITVAGSRVNIDYVMSTTGARYGAKIDSTVDRQVPYSWALGDGSTIAGLEQAVRGGGGVPPMLPGGVRRAIIPSSLGCRKQRLESKYACSNMDGCTGLTSCDRVG